MNTKKYTIIAIICWVLLISSLIPMFRYAKYTNPSADDYTYSNSAKLEYDKSESIILTINAGINRTIKAYSSWQGTYFGTFLMSISPNVFSINLYKFVPILLMLIFILSILLFIFVFIKYIFNSKTIYAFIISPIIIFISISFIPSLVEGFYWYNGAWYYTFSYCLSLVFFSSLIIFLKHKNKKVRVINSIFAVLLALMIGGSNFTTSFFVFIILLSLNIIMFLYKLNKKYYILGITVINLIGLLTNYLAPGNLVRGEVINSKLSILDSIFYSFKGTFIFNFDWLANNFIFLFLILLIPIFKNIITDSNFKFNKPILFIASIICLFSVQFTPPLYSMSNYGVYRLINIVYYASVIFTFAIFIYMYGYILKRKNNSKSIILNKKNKSKFKTHHLVSIIILSLYIINVNFNMISFVVAINNINNGSAQKYDQEYKERLLILENDLIKDVEFSEFTVKPYGLYFDDVVEDETNWKNKAMSRFYYKDSIVLKTE